MRTILIAGLLLSLAGGSAVADLTNPSSGWGPRLRFASSSYAGPEQPPPSSYTGTCSTLSDVTVMPAKTWCEVPDTDMRSVAPSPLPEGGAGAPRQVYAAWSGGDYDPVTDCLYMNGGGHADYSGNELYSFCMADLSVDRPWGPTPVAYIPSSSPPAAWEEYDNNGTAEPASVHSYSGLSMVPHLGVLMRFGGSPWYTGGGSDPTWRYYPDGSTPTREPDFPLTLVDGGMGSIYYPPLDRVIVFHTSRTIQLYNANNDTWAATSSTYSGSRAHDHSYAWDQDNDVIVIAGFGSLYLYDPNADTFSTPTPSGCTTALAAHPGGGTEGLAYDPQSGDTIIHRSGAGNTSVWKLVLNAGLTTVTCTEVTASGSNLATPPTNSAGYRGSYGRWRYSAQHNVFLSADDFDDNIYLYRYSAPETVVQTLTVEATTTGPVPFTTTVSMADGAVADKPSLSVGMSQSACLSEYPSGYCRTAVVSGIVPVVSGEPQTVYVLDKPHAEATALTASDISDAIDSNTASMQFGSEGTVNLNTIKSTDLIETVYSGPVMVEAVYGDTVTAGTGEKLMAKFFVRMYRDGRMRVRVAAYNGGLQTGFNGTETISYVPTITIDGSTVFNNGGASLEHPNLSGYNAVAWIGGDPGVSVVPDMAQLRLANAVPNYMDVAPTTASLNALDQSYVPLDPGSISEAMGTGGYHDYIGLVTNASSLVVTSDGDSRAVTAAMVEAESLYSFPVAILDETTLKPAVITDYGLWTIYGDFQGGAVYWSTDTGALTYDIPHHPHPAYIPFLLTADPYYLEIMQAQAVACYLGVSAGHGSGSSRRMYGQTRGIAWCADSIAQVVSVSDPADEIAVALKAWLDFNVTTWNGSGNYEYFYSVNSTDISPIGILFVYDGGGTGHLPATEDGFTSFFEFDFFVSSLVFARQLQVLPDNDDLDDVIAFMSQAQIGRLGPNGTDNYCFTKGSEYTIAVSTEDYSTPLVPPSGYWFGGASAWGDAYEATHGSPNTSCGNTLEGSSGGSPTTTTPSYWVQLLAATAQLADMEDEGVTGVTGAIAALARVAGATNGTDPFDSTCDHAPIFCIEPK